jgi:RNA polymerase sigma-70 factor (ECF subfamily)
VQVRLAIRITGSHNDSEDIYQETSLKVYAKRGDVPFECYFSTWIFRIVTNVCLDCLRRTRNHRGHSAMDENVEDEGVEYDLVNPDGTLRQIDIDKCCSLVSVG